MLPQTSLQLFHFPDADLEGWKTYPIRVIGPRAPKCGHGEFTVLVHSQERGMVKANCPSCGTQDTLSEHEIPIVAGLDRLPVVQ